MAKSLHEKALDAEQSVEELITSLAQANTDEGTLEALRSSATAIRDIVRVLGTGQEDSGDDEPPADALGEAVAQMPLPGQGGM